MYILIKRTTYLTRNGDILDSISKAYYSNCKKEASKKLVNDYNKLIKYIDKRGSLYKLGEDKALTILYKWCADNEERAKIHFKECSKIRGEDRNLYPLYQKTCIEFEIIKARAIPCK